MWMVVGGWWRVVLTMREAAHDRYWKGMVSLEELRYEKRAAILDAARRHGARSIRVYGSVARGQATDSSDLDLLVEWESDRSLLDVVGLKQDLEDLLGVTVDIGSERGLHWFIRDEVLREAVPL
jgi:predicted nucleotidyltransferase